MVKPWMREAARVVALLVAAVLAVAVGLFMAMGAPVGL
jgi:hypothetical protein